MKKQQTNLVAVIVALIACGCAWAELTDGLIAICPSGTSLEFDGRNDYVNCGSGVAFPTGNSDRTLMAWIKTTGTGYRQIISYGTADHSRAMTLGQNSGRVFVSSWGAPQYATSNFSINDGNWHHIAFVLDSQIGKVYVNGVLKDSRPFSPNTTPGQSKIGSRLDGATEFFNGLIDEVAIYNGALSAEEIQATMHTKLNGDEPGLLAYWDFDDGEGQIAADISGNGNDGTLGSTEDDDDRDPGWVFDVAPVGICNDISLDIKPGSCPNPLNVKSKGVLPVAILGSEDFDVSTIIPTSVRLTDVAPIRDIYEDVAGPVADANECGCTTEGPDGYPDLVLKFRTQEIVDVLIDDPGDLTKGDILALGLTGELLDGGSIVGSDCVVLVGNVSRWLQAKDSDINEDGKVDSCDLAELAMFWLEKEERRGSRSR